MPSARRPTLGFDPGPSWPRPVVISTAAVAAACVAVIASLGAQATGQARHAAEPIHMVPEFRGVADRAEHLMLPMRDGKRLWTSVYFPKNVSAPAPTVLVRTPYAFAPGPLRPDARPSLLARLLGSGYAIVYQNERGRFWSEGEFHTLTNSVEDGYDTLDWIAKQPWSNRKVGSFGCSSTGDTQTNMAIGGHPAFAASINGASGSSIGNIGPFNEQGLFYRGGVVSMPWASWYTTAGQRDFPKFPEGASPDNRDWLAEEMMLSAWMRSPRNDVPAGLEHLPIQDAVRRFGGQGATDWDDYVKRAPNDPAWTKMSLLRPGHKIHTPTLWLFQTHDIGVGPNVAGFEYASSKNGGTPEARQHQHMIMSPLGHCSYAQGSERTMDGDREIGDARYQDIEQLFVDWFDHWLRGTGRGITSLPKAQVYVPGKNSWESFREWPPAGAAQRTFYFESRDGAATRMGDGQLAANIPARAGQDAFTYDPHDPVPTVGGDACCTPDVKGSTIKPGSYDQAAIELRKDVLVYTSAPLDQSIDVVGFADVNLFVSSDAADTDFTANLVDLAPDGRAYLLNGSIQRARWRDGYDAPRFMQPGQVYKVRVGPFWVANRFERGHRIRVDVSSSSFPRWERNLNTGGRNYDESKGRPARNVIHFGTASPSHVVLPVVRLHAR